MHEKIEVNLFYCPMDKKCVPLKMNGVLENILICVQFSLKLAIVK